MPEGVLGQIDPSMLMNGLYTVILEATDLGGNIAQDNRVIRVTGDLKVGNFSITFEDFSAPVAGIPVTVLRTYDTRQRNEELDFGYGWSIDYQNVRLQESRDIGFSWSLIEEDSGLFSDWCVRPNGDPTVTVRLPDGEVETFVARAVPECTFAIPTVDVNIEFVPIDGTDSTLEQLDFGTVRIIGSNIVDLGEPDTPIDPEPVPPDDAGRVCVRAGSGLRRTPRDRYATATRLTYSNAGIVHSQGFALDFVRDPQGRIESIVAPDGSTMSYGYDVNGDLTSYTDAENNVTTFTYTNATDHYLEDIIDPRGIRVSRNEYDADGRLIAIIDADGNRVEYTHDVIGRTETNDLGETTTSTYDERNLLETITDPQGVRVMTNVYDTRNTNLQTMTDALGQTTTFFWDSGIGTCSTGASEGSLDAENNRTTIQPQCFGPFAELPAWEDDAPRRAHELRLRQPGPPADGDGDRSDLGQPQRRLDLRRRGQPPDAGGGGWGRHHHHDLRQQRPHPERDGRGRSAVNDDVHLRQHADRDGKRRHDQLWLRQPQSPDQPQHGPGDLPLRRNWHPHERDGGGTHDQLSGGPQPRLRAGDRGEF